MKQVHPDETCVEANKNILETIRNTIKEKISETINLRLSGNKSESNESLYNEERSNEQNEKETLKIPIDL